MSDISDDDGHRGILEMGELGNELDQDEFDAPSANGGKDL